MAVDCSGRRLGLGAIRQGKAMTLQEATARLRIVCALVPKK